MPVMNDTFACQDILEVATSDRRPPYEGREMEEYCEQTGFQHRITAPEDAQAYGFTETFVKVLVKPPWDADPWTVTEVKGSQLRVQRGEKQQLRANNLYYQAASSGQTGDKR